MKKRPSRFAEKKLDPRRLLKAQKTELSEKKKTKKSCDEVSEPKLPLLPFEIFMIDLKKEFNNDPNVDYEGLGAERWKWMSESEKARYDEMWKMKKEEYDQAKINANKDTESDDEPENSGSDDQTSTSSDDS